MDGLNIIEASETEPITLEEVKSHLRILTNDEDTLISSYISAARIWSEKHINRSFVEKTFEYSIDCFSRNIKLPYPPLISILSIEYTDVNENTLTMLPSNYIVDTKSFIGRVYIEILPSVNLRKIGGISIRYKAGYKKLPENLKHALKLIIGHLYENREHTSVLKLSDIPFSALTLLDIDNANMEI